MLNRFRILIIVVTLSVMVSFIGGQALSAAPHARKSDQPAAEVMIGTDGIYFVPKIGNSRLLISVSTPDGTVVKKSFDTGGTPYLGLGEVSENQVLDGTYTYEIRVSPMESKIRREGEEFEPNSDMKTRRAITQTGYFTVRGGMIVTPSNMAETQGPNLSGTKQTINEDTYIIGNLCVGADCSSPETFGDDVIRLKESNLRLHFEDTSSTSAYPANDWRILINDTTDGGADYFAVEDATAGDVPFKIEAGAPDNSLYIEDYGRIGIKTSTPATDLHIVAGVTPCTRLEQDTTQGYSAQVWDIAGNESHFFIKDVTNSSNVPFKIQPATPSNTLCLKSDGNVGIGTWTPGYPLEVKTTDKNAVVVTNRTDGATCYINSTTSYGNFGTTTAHPIRMVAGQIWQLALDSNCDITMRDGGGYNGTWNPASSRELKENIRDLAADEAMEALTGLNPVKYNYKEDKAEDRVGFIAEDVPELVAMNGRKTLGTVDIIAVLTKVVQEQQETLKKQQLLLHEQQKTLTEQQETISQLGKRLAQLENNPNK